MTTRRTLKDFLNFDGHANVDKISYDINNPESGQIDTVQEGDDLGKDPNTQTQLLGENGLIGNYLKYTVDKASNVHKFKGGNETASPTSRGSYLEEAHDQGTESTFIDQDSHLYNDIQSYSNSGKMDDSSDLTIGNSLDKIGSTIEGTGNILKEVEGTSLNQTNRVLVDANGETTAQKLSYQLLKNHNRFAPVNQKGAYKDNNTSDQEFESSESLNETSRVEGTQLMSKNFGNYDKNEIDGKISLDQLKGLGASILFRAGGWDLENSPGSGIDTSIENNPFLKNEVERIAEEKIIVDSTDNLKINLDNVRSRNAYTAPVDSSSGNSIRDGKGDYASQRSNSQSTLYNTEVNFTGKNSKLIKYQAAAALLSIFKLFEEQITVLEQYADGQTLISNSLNVSKFYEGAGPYAYGTHKTSGINILDFVRKHILVSTTYSYGVCFKVGMKILFGIDEDNKNSSASRIVDNSYRNFLDDSAGYWQSVSFAVIRRYKSLIDDIEFTLDPIHNFNSFVQVLRDNSIIQFINVIATIGDIRLQSTQGSTTLNGGSLPNDVDSLSDDPQNRVKKGRSLSGYTKLERSLNQRSLPSMYLLPGNVIKAVADMGTTFTGDNPTKGMLGSSLADKTYIDRFLTKSYNKIPIEIARKLEDQLEGEYVPFYIQDLRTNEVIAFHAFLTKLSDTISPKFDAKSGYGRLDPVQIYNSTTRSVDVSFNLIATSKEDFDEMWFKINKIVTLLYPQWTQGTKLYNENARFVQPFSQVIGASPIVRLRVGDVIKSNYSKFNLARIHGLGDEEMNLKPSDDQEGVLADIKSSVNEFLEKPIGNTNISYQQAIFEAFYALAGSPLQYKAFADSSGEISRVGKAAISAVADVGSELLENGFVNPLVITQLLNTMKDPDIHEKTNFLSGKNFGFKANRASYAYLRPNVSRGYPFKGKMIKTDKSYKVRIVKVLSPSSVPDNSQEVTNSANNSITGKSGNNFKNMKREGFETNRTRYLIKIIDFAAPQELTREDMIVYHSDLIPDYGNIYNKRVAPLLSLSNPVEAFGETVKGVAKSFASKIGVSSDSIDGLLNDVLGSDAAKFVSSDYNPITRAFETSMGRGLAGVLGNMSFNWLNPETPWEIDYNSRAPIGCEISFSLSVIHDLPPGLGHDGYNRAPIYNVGDVMKHVSGDANGAMESGEFSYRNGKTLIDKALKK